jgi:GT2 family glycosyltransferase
VVALNCGRNQKEFSPEKFSNKRVLLKHSPVNLGHPCAVNYGIQYAVARQYEFFLKLDDDVTLITPDWYQKCMDLMAFDRQIGVIGPKQLKPDEKTVQAAYIRFVGKKLMMSAGEPREKPELNRILRVSIAPNAFFFARVEYLKKVGYYDILFTPSQFDDVDYCFRMWLKGYSCVYDGRIEIVHRLQGQQDDPRRKLVSLANQYAIGLKYKGLERFGLKLEGEIDALGREISLMKGTTPASPSTAPPAALGKK